MTIGNPVTLTSNIVNRTISITATNGQTSFTIPGGYNINFLSVFRNGVHLVDGSDYTARDGVTVILESPTAGGDVLDFQIFEDYNVVNTVDPKSAVTFQDNVTVGGRTNTVDISASGNIRATGIITASSINATTFTGSAALLDDLPRGVGIQSGTARVGYAITDIKILGTGVTAVSIGNTVSISFPTVGVIGEQVGDRDALFGYISAASTVSESITLDTNNAGDGSTFIFTVIPNITVASGVGVTVGIGKTLIIDVLQLGDIPNV